MTTITETRKNYNFPADYYRERARQSMQTREESWERSDSDGFLTQWANQQMALAYEHAAAVAEDGYRITKRALFDLEGNLVTDIEKKNQWGYYFYIPEAEGKNRFVSLSEARNFKTARKNNEKKGYRLGEISVPVRISSMAEIREVDGEVQIVTTDLYQTQIDTGRTSWY